MNLNDEVWATIRPSKVHGVGVIAIRNVPKGQKMYLQELQKQLIKLDSLDELEPEIRTLIQQRWPKAPQQPFAHPNEEVWFMSFMNHAEKANYDPQTDCALRNIKKGEEVFETYGELAKDLLKIQ